MPIFEYRCPKCLTKFEIRHLGSEGTDSKCVNCNVHLEKQISLPAIRFIGKGFHCNDYKSKE